MSNTETPVLNRFDENNMSRPDRRDPLRNVPLIKVGIDCAVSGLVEVGYNIPFGYSEIVIYKDELAKLEGLVEKDQAGIAEAKRYVEEEFDEFERTGKNPELRECENWPATFRRNKRRSPKPLTSIKMIEEMGVPKSPEDKKLAAGTDLLVEAINRLLSLQSAATSAPSKK